MTCLLLFAVLFAKGQTNVAGYIKDKAHNKFIHAANVKLANVADSSLEKLTLTNGEGHFTIENIKAKRYLLILSHINYEEKVMEIELKDNKPLQLDTIYMDLKSRRLAEVKVTPGLYYNKDTLEISTAAFKLDSNAVVSDLLKKVPGFVIWGNGDVTYNGKKIQNFVLNGKKFFTGDPKIILQNIPKESTRSIQLYNTIQHEDRDDRDSILELNVKTKYRPFRTFGNAEYNIGKRYDSSLGINIMFKSRTQAGVFFNKNNVNKEIANYADYLSQNTYRSENQMVKRNLLREGDNNLSIYGGYLSYSFTDKPDREKVNKLTFSSDDKISESTMEGSDMIKNPNADIQQQRFNRYFQKNDIQTNTLAYQYSKGSNYFNTSFVYANRKSNLSSLDSSQYWIDEQSNVLRSESSGNTNEKQLNYQLAGYTRLLKRIGLKFDFSTQHLNHDNDNQRNTKTDLYQESRSNISTTDKSINQLKINLSNIPFISRLGSTIYMDTKFNLDKSTDQQDITANNFYRADLSYLKRYHQSAIDLIPGISFYRQRTLTNRYSKSSDFRIFLKTMMLSQKQTADNQMLNDSLTKLWVFPGLSYNYRNQVIGKAEYYLKAEAYSQVKMPKIDSRVFLMDTLNKNAIAIGNPNLIPAVEYIINMNASRNTRSSNESLLFTLAVKQHDFVTDISTLQNTYVFNKMINNDKITRYISLRYNWRKYYKIRNFELTSYLDFQWNNNNLPGHMDGQSIASKINRFSTNLKADISTTPRWTYSIGNTLDYTLVDRENGYNFLNNNLQLDLRYSLLGKLTIDASLINVYSGGKTAQSNNLFNMAIGYRFLKQQNAEIAFSAWDIFKNNKNLVNEFDGVNYISGYNNRIQQYFNLSLKYFIRVL